MTIRAEKGCASAGASDARGSPAASLGPVSPGSVLPSGVLLGLCAWRGRFGSSLQSQYPGGFATPHIVQAGPFAVA